MGAALKVFGIIALLFGGYYAYWQYQYGKAESAANDFCASVAVGSDISKTIDLLEAKGGLRHGFQEQEKRYIVNFPGPIFNAFTCEIELADRKVVSKRIEEPKD